MSDEGGRRRVNSLFINVAEAKNLPALDFGGTSDPYCVVSGFGTGEILRTPTVYKECNPFWGQAWTLGVENLATHLQCVVFDENRKKDVPIGKVMIPFRQLAEVGECQEQWYHLMPVNTRTEDFVSGCIDVEVSKTVNTVTVKLFQGRGLASKDSNGLSDPYARVRFDKAEYKSSTKFKTLDPEYNETFQFALPSARHCGGRIEIVLYDYDKLSSDDFMGSVIIPLADIGRGESIRRWYEISAYDPITKRGAGGGGERTTELGSIRLKLHYQSEVILPEDAYEPLLALLTEPGFPAIHAIAKVTRERETLAKALVALFASRQLAVPLLNDLNSTEIRATENPRIIFRGNSLATKANDMYLKLVGRQYLVSTLQSHIDHIFASSLTYEVDPTRLDDQGQLEGNWRNLKALVQRVLDGIFASALACPSALSAVFASLRESVLNQFEDPSVVQYTVVSAFLFLRFFCPAILGPKLFGLHDEHPAPQEARTLTLVAKTVQNLANLVGFGPKEPFMHPMNELIDANLDAMKQFLDTVSAAPTDELSLIEHAAMPAEGVDAAHQAARVFGHFCTCYPDMLGIIELPDGRVADMECLLGVLDQIHMATFDTPFVNIAEVPMTVNDQHASVAVDAAAAPLADPDAADEAGEDELGHHPIEHSTTVLQHTETVDVSPQPTGTTAGTTTATTTTTTTASTAPETAAAPVGDLFADPAFASAPSSATTMSAFDDLCADMGVDLGRNSVLAELAWQDGTSDGTDGAAAAAPEQTPAGAEPEMAAVAPRASAPSYAVSMMDDLSERFCQRAATTSSVSGDTFASTPALSLAGAAEARASMLRAPGTVSATEAVAPFLFGGAPMPAKDLDEHGFERPVVRLQSIPATRTEFEMPTWRGMDVTMPQLMEEAARSLRTESRMVTKTYNDCFVGSALVNFVMRLTRNDTDRGAAAHVAQQMVDAHIVRFVDAPEKAPAAGTFGDGYLFYQVTSRRDESMPKGMRTLLEQMSIHVPRETKTIRREFHDNVFIGSEFVAFIITVAFKMNPVRSLAVAVASELLERNYIAAVSETECPLGLFEDGYVHYYLVADPVIPDRPENALETACEIAYYDENEDNHTAKEQLMRAGDALMAWANIELGYADNRITGRVITDIETDLRDGVLLNEILTVICPSYSCRHALSKSPNTRAEEVDNIMLVLRFLQGAGLGTFMDPTCVNMFSQTAIQINEGNILATTVILHTLRKIVRS